MKTATCKILTVDEFEQIIKKHNPTSKSIIVHYDMDGIWYEYFDESVTDIDAVAEKIFADYFGAEVDSIHIDDEMFLNVWIALK